jgi:ABC-type lipoprotein release transport system permease subunit
LSWGVFDFVPHPIGDRADPNWARAFYLPIEGAVLFAGKMTPAEQDALNAAGGAKPWRDAVRKLARESTQPGMIVGARLIEVKKNREGELVGREAWKYRELWAKLTVFGIGANQETDLAGSGRGERTYWIVDDSRTGMWQYDNNAVYVPFDVLQVDLGMEAGEAEDKVTGQKYKTPARASEINVKLKPGTDVAAAQAQIAAVVERVVDAHANDRFAYRGQPRVESWRQASAVYLDQIEREKVMMVLLFGVISVVAVFLIFCIFYMIVAEKTKDIGIVKSVGATNGGVAGIFLGYGLAIGLVGAGLGLLLSYLIVNNVNEIHDWLGRTFRLVVYNPEVYAFDTIPNRMDPPTVAVILAIAVLASVVGALLPAIRAARMQPVEALRWE